MRQYRKPWWALYQHKTQEGVVEDICVHGFGHPNKEWLKEHPGQGCDGTLCCSCCTLPDAEDTDGKVD